MSLSVHGAAVAYGAGFAFSHLAGRRRRRKAMAAAAWMALSQVLGLQAKTKGPKRSTPRMAMLSKIAISDFRRSIGHRPRTFGDG
jgi:putative hemolysin